MRHRLAEADYICASNTQMSCSSVDGIYRSGRDFPIVSTICTVIYRARARPGRRAVNLHIS